MVAFVVINWNILIDSISQYFTMNSTFLLLAVVTSFAQTKPDGIGYMMRDLFRRQAPPPPNQTVEMIGDLLTTSAITPLGTQVKTCLEDASGATCVDNDKKLNARSFFRAIRLADYLQTCTQPGKLGSSECAKDICCV